MVLGMRRHGGWIRRPCPEGADPVAGRQDRSEGSVKDRLPGVGFRLKTISEGRERK